MIDPTQREVAIRMSTMTVDKPHYFFDEVEAQWIQTVAARNRAWQAGDTWFAELLDGRLDELRDLVQRHHPGIPSQPTAG